MPAIETPEFIDRETTRLIDSLHTYYKATQSLLHCLETLLQRNIKDIKVNEIIIITVALITCKTLSALLIYLSFQIVFDSQ